MSRLVRAELRKATTTRLLFGLTLGGVVLVAFYAIVYAFIAGTTTGRQSGLHDLSDPAAVRLVYGVPFLFGYLMPLVFGVIAVSGEYRHKTITPTYLATPRRSRVLQAKVVAAAIIGAAMGLVLTVVVTVVGAITIAARGYPVLLTSDGVPRLLILTVLGLGVWAVFGVGFGALLKNQIAAVIAVVVLVNVLEPLLALFLRWIHAGAVAKVLPTIAANAIVAPSNVKAADILPWWGGALALLAWGLVTATLGSVISLRRDVT